MVLIILVANLSGENRKKRKPFLLSDKSHVEKCLYLMQGKGRAMCIDWMGLN